MSKQWQIRRGTTDENDAFTGAVGEITMDTDKKAIRIHDGSTQGGIKIPSETTADYVVEWQMPATENNYTWYRKYKSGWVEQGGNTYISSAGQIVSLPVYMADTNYTATSSGGSSRFGCTTIYNKTTTSFAAWVSDDDTFNAGILSWCVYGIGE